MNELPDNTAVMVAVSALAGYLFGSISNARIFTWFKTRSMKVKPINEPVPGTDLYFSSDAVSATVANINLGKKFGIMTALLDMLKVALPTLAIRLLFPGDPWFLITATSGIAGHNYPIYHRFKGGRGESPILGAMLVINWFGIFVSSLAGTVLGYLTGSVLVMRYGWYVLSIFWYWIYFNNIYYVGFMIAANILFWTAMSKDLLKFAKMKEEDDLDVSEETVSDFLLMGKGPGRFLDRYGLPSIVRNVFKKKRKFD
jgi:glycerol-3-phosphate acyltransferase PlsY